MPRRRPMASAVRMVSEACCGPIGPAAISVALPASLSRIASSTAISSNGFIDILTLASSTPVPSDFTRIFTSLSTTRLTGTRTFMAHKLQRGRANYGCPGNVSTCCIATSLRFCGGLAVLPGHPQDFPGPPSVDERAGDEEEIRQPVDVFEGRGRDRLAGPMGELDHQALAAPAH